MSAENVCIVCGYPGLDREDIAWHQAVTAHVDRDAALVYLTERGKDAGARAIIALNERMEREGLSFSDLEREAKEFLTNMTIDRTSAYRDRIQQRVERK